MINKSDSIFVTGGTGFIGAYILRELLHRGYQNIFALRRKDSRMQLVAPFTDQINWVIGDIRDPYELDEALSGIDYVIHAAAIVSFHPSDRDLLYAVNVEGTANLVNQALAHQVKKLIHISSIAAIGRKEETNIIDEEVEWERSKHNSKYAISKHLAEMEVWRGTAEGMPALILNPANVMGSGFWGEGTARTFQQIWDGFPFFTNGQTGFVDVRDVARFAVSGLESEVVNQRYILSEQNYSYQHIFQRIASHLNKKAPHIQVKRWMIPYARIGDWVKSKFSGKRPFLTKEITRNSFHQWQYVNQKSKSVFDFEYTPIEKTIQETASLFTEAQEKGSPPRILPI